MDNGRTAATAAGDVTAVDRLETMQNQERRASAAAAAAARFCDDGRQSALAIV